MSLGDVPPLWRKNILHADMDEDEREAACTDTCEERMADLRNQIRALLRSRDEERAANHDLRVTANDLADYVVELEEDNRELCLEVENWERIFAQETCEAVRSFREDRTFPGDAAQLDGYTYLEATLEVPYEEDEQEAEEEQLAAAFETAVGEPQTVPGDDDYQEPLVDAALEVVPVVDVDVINGRSRFTKPDNIQWISSIIRLAQVLECQPETMPVWPKGSVEGVAVSIVSQIELPLQSVADAVLAR